MALSVHGSQADGSYHGGGGRAGLPGCRFHAALAVSGDAEVLCYIDYITRKKGQKAAAGERQHAQASLC